MWWDVRVSDRIVSYRPGSWFAVVGEHCTVLLPSSEKDRAGVLWAAVDGGAGFDAVLDTLLAGGLSTLPGFVLLASTGERDDVMRVVIRGDASATFESEGGTVLVQGASDSMWVERTLHGVTSYAVTLPDDGAEHAEHGPGGPELTVLTGLVRVGAVESPREQRLAPVIGLAPAPDPLTDDFAMPAPEDEPPLAWSRGWDEPDEPDVEEQDQAYDEPAEEPTPAPLGSPPAWTPPTVPPPAVPPVPVPPVPVPPVPAPSAPSAWLPGDDALTEQLPVATEPPAAPPAEAAPEEPEEQSWLPPGPVAHLAFSSGDEIDVDRLVVVGRAPDAGRFAPEDEPLLVQVPSPHSEISATHLEVRPGSGDDHGYAVVTDLGSTNGTLVIQPGERPDELRPGVPVRLLSGALIDLGDGLTIRVSDS